VTSPGAPTVHLELPSLLRPVAGWRRLACEGRTIGEALEFAFGKTPVLRHHLLLDTGELRPHVLCILDGVVVPRGNLLATPLTEGAEILIHQAISGG